MKNYKFETNINPGENLLGFILTPKVSVPYQVLKAICKEIMEALNEEIFDGFLDAKTVGNMITYSAGPDNGSTMVGIINEELSFNICLM